MGGVSVTPLTHDDSRLPTGKRSRRCAFSPARNKPLLNSRQADFANRNNRRLLAPVAEQPIGPAVSSHRKCDMGEGYH